MLYAFILYLCWSLISNCRAVYEIKCKNPSVDELKQKLQSEMINNFYMIPKGFEPDHDNQIYISNVIFDLTDSVYQNQKRKECSIIDNFELCPHTHVNVTRNDRFPYLVNYSLCDCSSCLFVHNGHCESVVSSRPILYRTFCNASNIWEWKLGIEKIPVECICIHD
ncbi:unnamed protein product [Brachionus calyciflorus]|uniref:Uncharacterized protein n=1 Tax=Brachionus calyciflorus TaxID=104777 RepID=A0A813RSR2_9BILA|nr:unnamed protein product [Brachionus calyciflorus]